MLGVGLSIEFGARDTTIPTRILRKLKQFPSNIYDDVETAILNRSAQRASQIMSHRSKKSTYEIRKRQHRKGIQVPTYKGQLQVPNDSRAVGDRTGTFLGDYSKGEEPGVEKILSKEYRIQNGLFVYRINPEAYSYEYPLIFEEWLQGKGWVPEDGFLDFGEDFDQYIAGLLEFAVLREIDKKIENTK